MKKIIFSIFALPLIALCCSMNLHAQSSETDLDQVELVKQFIGSWVGEWAEDTTIVWEVIPLGKGYEQIIYWKAKGETYRTDKGIIGLTLNGYVGMLFLWSPNGNLSRDYGKFESDKKITMERFNADHIHVFATFDYHLITADKIKMTVKMRGTKESWDDAVVWEIIWTRVKK